MVLSKLQISGMVAALTPLPVVGVPVRASTLDGLDSLLSIVQVFFSLCKYQCLQIFHAEHNSLLFSWVDFPVMSYSM